MNILEFIRSKLVYQFNLVLIPVILIGFALSSYFITSSSLSSLDGVVSHKINGSATLIKKSIESWLQQNEQLIVSIATSPQVQKALTTDFENLQDVNVFLKNTKDSFGFRNMALLDEQGVAIASAKDTRLGANYAQFDYFKRALRQSEIVIAKPRLSRVDHTPLLTMAVIVLGDNKKGVLFVSLPLTNMYKNLVSSTASDPQSLSFVLTSDCQALAHPNSSIILTKSSNYREFCQSSEKLIEFNENGLAYIAASIPLNQTNWHLVSAVEKRTISEISDQLTIISMTVGLIIALIVAMVLVLLFRSITHHLNFIEDSMNTLSLGDIELSPLSDKKLQVLSKRKDELGHIGLSLKQVINNQQHQSDSAANVAAGNLAIQPLIASEKDVLGKAFSTMVSKISGVLNTIHESSEQVVGATSQMRQQSKLLSSGAEQQTQAIELVSSALLEMTEQVKLTTQSLAHVSEKSDISVLEAHQGETKMQKLSKSIDSLHETGAKISDIMKVISGIAANINLIALNAAIEAARAGEHGRGFAVVASEIRLLAEQTTQAAEDSNLLISETIQQMNVGRSLAASTQQTFEEIVEHINQSAKQITLVSNAQAEQELATEHLSDALLQIEYTANDNVGIAQQTMAQNELLIKMSEQLVKEAEYFSVS